MTYVFVFYEVCKLDGDITDYRLLDQIEVDTRRFTVDELEIHLRWWALRRLRERRCDIGLYSAEFSMLDEFGQPDQCVREEYIAWSGRAEIGPGSLPSVSNFLSTLWTSAEVPLAVRCAGTAVV